jgi:hypothetical protein
LGTNNPVNQHNDPEVLSPQQYHGILKPHKDLVTNWLPHEKLVETHAGTVAALKNYTLITFLSGFPSKILYKFLIATLYATCPAQISDRNYLI